MVQVHLGPPSQCALTRPKCFLECSCWSGPAVRIGSGTFSGLTSVSGCPAEARCLGASKCLPAARPAGLQQLPNRPRRGLPYRVRVNATLLWPAHSETSRTLQPAATRIATKLCRRPWKVMLGIPARMTAGLTASALQRRVFESHVLGLWAFGQWMAWTAMRRGWRCRRDDMRPLDAPPASITSARLPHLTLCPAPCPS